MSEYRKNISKNDPSAIKMITEDKSRPIWVYLDQVDEYLNLGYIIVTGSEIKK